MTMRPDPLMAAVEMPVRKIGGSVSQQVCFFSPAGPKCDTISYAAIYLQHSLHLATTNRAFCCLSALMQDSLFRRENLENLASLLRLAAETLRLYSDTEDIGGDYISMITTISLQIDESAAALVDLTRREAEDVAKYV